MNFLDTYEIKEKAGAGGAGSVYKAYHKRLKKEVVIKKLHNNIQDDVFQRVEADILKNLHHPYLPQVFDFFVEDGIAYTVMDFISGETFQEILNRGKKFSEKQVLKYATQLCEALDYLHSQKIPIIHGDIKPDNIMLTSEDNICLIDFNISGISEGEHAVTFGCTEGYCAPEQYEAFKKIRETSRIQTEKTNGSRITEKSDSDKKTENLADNEKTELFSQNDKTELISALDKTEFISQDDKTEVLFESEEKKCSGREVTKKEADTNSMEGIPIDKRTDIYSLGATLYHLYTGKRFDLDKGNLLQTNSGEGFTYILNKALQTNPDNRFRDAGEMLKIIKSIHKVDVRYKKVILLQNVVRVGVVFFLTIGILMIYQGKKQIDAQKQDEYIVMIQEMENARENYAEEEFEKLFDSATMLFPECLDAYYQKVLYLYEKKEYENCIDFVQTIENKEDWDSLEYLDEIYYIVGNSFFELEAYEQACNSFEKAVHYYGENGAYYVDYAISLARIDEIEKAEKALAQAKKWNVTDDNLSLVNGEINLALENYALAEQDFKDCISITSDEYILFRAYMMLSKTYFEQQQDYEIIQMNIGVLKEANQRISMEYRISILQQLVEAYKIASTLTGDAVYDTEAIEVLCEINNMGWGTVTTWNNLAVLYQKKSDYEQAKMCIQEMYDKNSNNYVVYKRYAFLELAVQESKEVTEREYSVFVEYYEKAVELYKTTMNENQTDSEMQLLENAYIQLQDGNWLP